MHGWVHVYVLYRYGWLGVKLLVSGWIGTVTALITLRVNMYVHTAAVAKKPTKAMKKAKKKEKQGKTGETFLTRKDGFALTSINFSLSFRNLRQADIFSKSDPFCEVRTRQVTWLSECRLACC